MKENKKKDFINRFIVPLIITCPVCGFTFKCFEPRTRKENQLCPMCNQELLDYSKLKLEIFQIMRI
ncbi:MAG: hypothetical protein ACFFCY_05615 [Promethearchaeota archaeon]|jgi:rubrerythrin